MNGRSVARLVLALVIVAGVTFLGVGAYNAGVSQGLAQAGQVVAAPGGYPVGPYIGGWGYGHGLGFGFFGFLGTLFFIFLFIGLLRAAFGHGRGWGGRGGWGGPGDPRARDHWEARVREVHDELHRTSGDQRAGGDSGRDNAPPA